MFVIEKGDNKSKKWSVVDRVMVSERTPSDYIVKIAMAEEGCTIHI